MQPDANVKFSYQSERITNEDFIEQVLSWHEKFGREQVLSLVWVQLYAYLRNLLLWFSEDTYVIASQTIIMDLS